MTVRGPFKIPEFHIGKPVMIPQSGKAIYNEGSILSNIPKIHMVYGYKGQGFEVVVADDGYNPHSNLSIPVTSDVYGYKEMTTVDGHGNMTQGVMGMQGRSIKGVIPLSKFHQKKFLGIGGGSFSDLVKILDWIYEYNFKERTQGRRGITHFNGSFSASPYYMDVRVKTAFKNLQSQNVKCFLSSGNEGFESAGFPSNLSSVFGIGAIRHDRGSIPFSNAGKSVDFVSWGVGILTTTGVDGEHLPVDGTSFSCPFACAKAVIIDQHFESLFGRLTTWDEMYQILKYYSEDLGSKGFDIKHGHGLITLDCIKDNFKSWIIETERIDLAPELFGPVQQPDDTIGPTPQPLDPKPIVPILQTLNLSAMKIKDILLLVMLLLGFMADPSTPESEAIPNEKPIPFPLPPIDSTAYIYNATFMEVDFERIKVFEQWSGWYNVDLNVEIVEQ